MAANFADLWEETPVNKMAGLQGDFAARLQAANEAWKAKTGKDLPINSGYRTPEEGIKLWGSRASNPNLVAKPGTSLHEKGIAADISPDIPDSFLGEFGLHRPFGKKDPVHVEANPAFKPKSASVTVAAGPASTNFADLWDTTSADLAQKSEKPKTISEAGKQFGKDVLGSLNEMSWEDFKKKSLIAPAATYTAASLGVPGFTEQDKQEAAKNLQEKGSAVVQGVTKLANMPVEDFSQGVMKVGKELVERPGKAAGEAIKSSIYDPELMFAGEAVNAVGKPFLAAGKKATSAIADVAMQDPAFAAKFAELKNSGASTKQALFQAWERIKDEQTAPAMAGVGAAETQKATVLKQAIETASPELSQALKTLDPKDIDIDVLNRRLKADSLPIPLKYTAGQATQDPVLISRELNARGKEPKLAEEFNQQNKILQENASAMKDRVAPDVFTESHVADSQGAIGNIEAKAKANAEATKQAYQDLKDAAGGQFPVDGRQFADNAINLLKAEDRLDYLPVNIQRKLNDYQTGKKEMNFNLFENLRTDLAAEIRKAQRAGDGNQAYVLGQVRGELEKLPMVGETAELKVLADKARGLAKADFDLERQNKIYSDVVNGKADTKNFISKNVINSTNKDFADTMALVADDPIAKQHLASGTLDLIIKDSTDASGNFLTGKFAKHINNLDLNGKLIPLFGEEAATLMDIAEASRIVGARPKGSFVNESNTLVGAMAEHAKTVAEHGTNVAFKGLPVGTLGRKFLNKRAASKELQETLSPIGGVKLKDIGKK